MVYRIDIGREAPMRLAELTAGFKWGVLLVKDANSTEQIPNWSSPDEQITAANSALVIRVMPDDEGNVDVQVVNDSKEVRGMRYFSGHLAVPSKTLKVGDALGEQSVNVVLDKENIGVEIYLDEPMQATCVSLLIRD